MVKEKWLMAVREGGPYLYNAFILSDLTITTHEQLFFHRGQTDPCGLVEEQVLCAMCYGM